MKETNLIIKAFSLTFLVSFETLIIELEFSIHKLLKKLNFYIIRILLKRLKYYVHNKIPKPEKRYSI